MTNPSIHSQKVLGLSESDFTRALDRTAQKFGTPFYAYFESKLSTQITALRDAFGSSSGFPCPVEIRYAMKACYAPHVLRKILAGGFGVDCVSVGEMDWALKHGFSRENMVFTPSMPSPIVLRAAVDRGILINIENLDALVALASIAREAGRVVDCLIRWNPNLIAGGNAKIQTGHKDTKFGISLDLAEAALKIVGHGQELKVIGFHIHTGSEIKDPKIFSDGLLKLIPLLKNFPSVKILDLGGGFPVAYRRGEDALPVAEISATLKKVLDETALVKNCPGLKLWFEPGKYLVSEMGVLVAEVQAVKRQNDRVWVGLNTGLHHLIRPMMYGSYHEADVLNGAGRPAEVVTLVGNICETDTLAEHRSLPRVIVGDLVVFYSAGAYGYSMASQYNLQGKPAEIWITDNLESELIRRAETLSEMTGSY